MEQKNLFSLSGKKVLIIGGRGYLGKHVASEMSGRGAHVCAADLPVESKASTGVVANLSEQVHQVDVDVSDPNSIESMVSEATDVLGGVDSLIYSVTTKPKDFYAAYTQCSLEGWKQILTAELDGLFLVTQQVGKVMEQAGSGNMVFISSIYGVVGNDQRIYEGANLAALYGSDADEQPERIYSHAAYNTAKGGVISLSRYLAAYWGHLGIRVNCISPGGVHHPGENEEFVARYAQKVPLSRKAQLDEVVSGIVYLASDAANYVTGHNLVVDGGWTAW